MTTDTTTQIDNTGGSPLAFDASDPPGGLGTQLAPNGVVGSGTFTQTLSGDVDVYALNLAAEIDTGVTLEDLLLDAMNTGGALRMIAVASLPGTAATYAGFNNGGAEDPTLVVTIPEPATASVVMLTAGGTLLGRCRRDLA